MWKQAVVCCVPWTSAFPDIPFDASKVIMWSIAEYYALACHVVCDRLGVNWQLLVNVFGRSDVLKALLAAA